MRQLTLFAIVLLVVVPAVAQTPSASLVGRVTDPSGAVVPKVSIQVRNLDTQVSKSGATNGVGDFTIPYLNPGRYELEAGAAGFRPYKHSGFDLEVGQTLRLDLRLEVGNSADVITVTDTPPAVNTDTGTRGDVTTNQEILELPLNGRSFSDLAYLTGGVVSKPENGDGQYSINGGRPDNVGFLLDGMNNTQRRNTGSMVSPPLEGIQEFKVITSGFSAEYGRFSGGMLTAVTKSGGNGLRGSLSEFVRNDIFDARNFFAADKSKLRQHQFGSTVTGPVYLPHLYNGHNRTFFLFSWESQRQISGSIQRGIVPTAAMLKGDFSAVVDASGKPVNLKDPLAGNSLFPNRQIPTTRLDPVSLKMAAYYPAPNLTGSANNYLAVGNSTSDYDNFNAKIDHVLSTSDRLSMSATWKPSSSFNPFQRSPVPIFGAANKPFSILIGIRELHTFTPTLLNEFSGSFSRLTNLQGSLDTARDWSAEIGFNGGTKNPIAMGLPFVSVSGYIDLGQPYDMPKFWVYNNYHYTDALTWIHGRHSVRFGGDFLRYQYFNKYAENLRGRVTATNHFTGDPMGDYVLGYLSSSQRLIDIAREYLFSSNFAGFVQDDFKITSNLTLNLCVRYELMKPVNEKYGARSSFVPSLGKLVVAGTGGVSEAEFAQRIQQSGVAQYIVRAADVGLPDTITKTNWHNFAPRFGFAWRPFSTNRSVIRGGYGIFYGTDSLYRYDELSTNYPYAVLQTFSYSSSNPLGLTMSNPFPAATARVAGISTAYGQQVNSPTQYTQSWSLTMERELGRSTVLEIAYAGSKGTHLPRRYDMNQPLYIPSLKLPNGSFPKPFPAFSNIYITNDIMNAHYNSGTVTLRHHLTKQAFIRASYVYGKSIDETSDTNGNTPGGFNRAQDSYNLHGERGRSDWDVGHSFAASFVFEPKLSRNVFLRDWQFSGTATAYTGLPFTPKVANYSEINGGASRPDRIAKGTVPNPTPERWFDPTAFPLVPNGSYRFGDSGRNILDGPGTINLNTSLSRRIRFSEYRALQFRWEQFNLLNHTNFNLPATQVDVINAGVISAAKNPRQMQLALRLEF